VDEYPVAGRGFRRKHDVDGAPDAAEVDLRETVLLQLDELAGDR
jgi:hypothetical protein